MTDVPPLRALMDAMNFTEHDLNENRRRRITPAQAKRLQNIQWRTVGIGTGVFVLLTFVASLCIYLGQRNSEIVFGLVGVGITVLNAIVIGFLARSVLRLSADLRSPEPLEIHEGILERIVRPNGTIHNYVLKVIGQEFSVTKDTFRQFRHQEVYSLYATTHARVLMSAECLSTPG